MIETFPTYEAADQHRQELGEPLVISGCYLDDECLKPVYFLTDPDTSDDRMREISFELKHGRAMEAYEQQLLEYVSQQVSA